MIAVQREEPTTTSPSTATQSPVVGDDRGEMLAGFGVGVRESDVGERLVEGTEVDLGDGRTVVGASRSQHHRTVRSRAPWPTVFCAAIVLLTALMVGAGVVGFTTRSRPVGGAATPGVRGRVHVEPPRRDDPIVHPGHPGAAHMHDFFGSEATDASSTAASLLGTRAPARRTRPTPRVLGADAVRG